MNVQMMAISKIRPYERNPRKNDEAVKYVAESIKQFGFKQPIVVDALGVIVAGHTRYKAAKKLGMKEVPCVVADDLTEEQVRAYRLADNKVAEKAEWDPELLEAELDGLLDFDMSDFAFEVETDDWFSSRERGDTSREEGNEEYNEFLDKFEAKKTTDDCYTPDNVYDAVAEWVSAEYNIDRNCFVRPFYPGGDYESRKYKAEDIVVDNPPFSILAAIIKFYQEKGIRFFLFAPTLTLFSGRTVDGLTYIPCGSDVTYENGATVNTSFVTNMDDFQIRTAPSLYNAVKTANNANLVAMHKELPKYSYPDHVVTAAMAARYCKYGVDYRVPWASCYRISELDEQKEENKAVYGGGFLLSARCAAEKAAAEKAAAEKAAAARWQLSEREWAIVKSLG